MPDQRLQRSINPSDVDHFSDEEILERYMNAPRIDGEPYVRHLTPKTIAKPSHITDDDLDEAAEANALNLVFAKSTIPVPRVRRVVKTSESFLIIMDYIPGRSLAEVWPTLSIWQKIGMAWTLRHYIHQLRHLEAPSTTPPGPISVNGPRICQSPLFGQVRPTRGSFASYAADLSYFFNKCHKKASDRKNIPLDDPLRADKFDDSEALVLTHHDLNLRNMILGEDGRLWIVDWGWSGYYPRWFEYIAMWEQNQREEISGTDDEFWKRLIPFVAGPYFRHKVWYDWMAPSLYYGETISR
ncbi:hypothetical protein E4T56_gene11349 [Termitomyces sp. T112]|nr:hypothetical protein E4T56_gene11349 [Termitomyces sp. T112]KAH0590467.1 hypothetical protein H2248_000616 [Termitomyces sp. 'cryptogamus']